MNTSDSLLSLLGIIKKWIRPIVIVCSIAVLATVIVSLQMDDYYKASTIFYAASSDLAKPAPIGGQEVNIEYYGRDEDIDRLLSIANSGELASKIIGEYDLAKHYDIKTDTPKGKFKVYERFNKLMDAKKNKFDAIQVTVEDKDPEVAMKMANRIRDLINEISQSTVKNSQKLLINNYRKSIEQKTANLDSLTVKIEAEKKKYGIFDATNQGQAYAEALGSAEKKSQRDFIMREIDEFSKGVTKVKVLEQEQREFGLQLSLDKERYKQLISAENSTYSAIHLIEKAEIPLIKSRPRRSILVIAAGMISLFFSLFAAVVAEKFRSINWKNL